VGFFILRKEEDLKRIQYAVLILLIFPTFILSSCCQPLSIPPPDETPQEKYLIDSLPGYIDQPMELDKEKLDILVEDIKEDEYGKIHSLIIIHYDSLVLEEYFMGWTRDMLHPVHSVTKSFSSALIGIAIEQGYINGVAETLLSFFPEYDDIENLDTRKESITLENVLTMTPGFKWDETSTVYYDECSNPTPGNDGMELQKSNDWIKYMLDLQMSDDPGTRYVYNSGGSSLLSGVLKNKTGKIAEEFASENLFSPLGITNWKWEKGPNGLSTTGWGLHLHPVNMAMFGYLYSKKGFLNGEHVISEDWVQESTSKHIEIIDPFSGEFNGYYYGYQWRIREGGSFIAIGYAGQFIYVIPSLNLIVVSTAENFEDPFGPLGDLITNIIGALVMKS
jgi:CubicO group peptidase (beta-lactamase class C family)